MPKGLVSHYHFLITEDEESDDPIGDALRADAVAYWKMDEASGTRADSAGNNDLSDVGSVGSVSGKINNAADFSGANNLVIAHNADMTTSGTSFTFALWARFDVLDESKDILGKGDADYEYYIEASYNDITLIYEMAFDVIGNSEYRGVVLDGYAIQINQWYFIVATLNLADGTLSLWVYDDIGNVNSEISDPGFITGQIGVADPFRVGFQWTFLNGASDEIGFWKRTLTANERAYLYNAGAGRSLY